MTKEIKQIIIWSVVVGLLAASLSVITFWKPYRVKTIDRIDAGYHEGVRTMLPNSPHYKNYEDAIRHTINRSVLSLFVKTDIDVEINDEYIALCREQAPAWIEFYCDEGDYKRLFFVVSEDEKKQMLFVIVTTGYTYDNAEVLTFDNCNCSELLSTMAQYATES